jgi:nucleoside-diphosphate-sugar epimerase
MNGVSGKRVVLVGGAGFIGHNLALKLKSLGAEVGVIDGLAVNNIMSFTAHYQTDPCAPLYLTFLNQRLELLREAGIPLSILDAREYHPVSLALEAFRPQVIVHLAAVAHADKSNKDPYSTFDHSMRTLENTLDFARQHQTEQFIYLSSSMIYGHFSGGMVIEDTHCEPLGIYAALKYGAERLILGYNQVFGLPYTIIRPSALYGERCVSRRVGQLFIESALQNKTVTILGNGSDRLDFTYIDDFVQGVVRAIASPRAINETFNITYGDSRSLKDMLDILIAHFPEVEVQYKPKDKLMPDRGTLSVDKARRLIGYDPQYPLDKGFPRYIEWYRELLAGRDCDRMRTLLTGAN